jgi:SAM-dependent methyltransferase
MLPENRARILERLRDEDRVLDVGGWAKPFPRADAVIDLMPYDTRGLYGEADDAPERFSAETWTQHDICARGPWPYADGEFDFVVCSHTLEDVRDPLFVCSELVRVARAGYVEVPSRMAEQAPGVQGPWVGWGHHFWLCDVTQDPPGIEFLFKHHILHGLPELQVPTAAYHASDPAERVAWFLWEGSFAFSERTFEDPFALNAHLAAVAEAHPPPAEAAPRRRWRR